MTSMSSNPIEHKVSYVTPLSSDDSLEYDKLIGTTQDGVPVMSNGRQDYESNAESKIPSSIPLSSFDKSRPITWPVFSKLGEKWQSFEFVRRYLASRKGVWMKQLYQSEDLWHEENLFVSIPTGQPINYSKFANHTTSTIPMVGDIIVYKSSVTLPLGHVAIVTHVNEKQVCVAEQNYISFSKWPVGQFYSRCLSMVINHSHIFNSNTHGDNNDNDINGGDGIGCSNSATSKTFKENYGVSYRNYNNVNSSDETDENSGKVSLHDQDDANETEDQNVCILGWIHVHASWYDYSSGDVGDHYRLITTSGNIIRKPVEPRTDLPWLRPNERCDFFLRRSLIVSSLPPESKEEEEENNNINKSGNSVSQRERSVAIHSALSMEGARADVNDVPSAFYFIDYDMWCRMSRAANSLHYIALAATAKVLYDQAEDASYVLEHYFNIPHELQPLLRRSWETCPAMCGRFDFGFDGKRLRMLEYNCDSSAALLECCDTQTKMAESYRIIQGESAGSFWRAKCVTFFTEVLSRNTSICPSHKLIHFMIDDDDEERYTALCVMNFAESAGFRTKLCVNLTDFRFAERTNNTNTNPTPCKDDDNNSINTKENGNEDDLNTNDSIKWDNHARIVDLEGEEVLLVWKTWSWDTVLHRYEKERKDHITQMMRKTPSLSDILLNEHICVLEPFWKTITGSKAILPFMYAIAPDHQNMLPASFLPTREIISTYHISKPVNGRAGQNITMHDPVKDEMILNEAPALEVIKLDSPLSRSVTGRSFALSRAQSIGMSIDRTNESSIGKFYDSIVVYQQRLFLKRFDHKYFPIFCGWILGNEFAGVVVREDTSKITKLGSVVIPARVVRFCNDNAADESNITEEVTEKKYFELYKYFNANIYS